VLKDISFKVKRGEVLGIIGRNGAGKSTLLKILSRITQPTVGEAVIHGRVGSLLEVGTGFHDELSGRENIYLNGTILGMKHTEITSRLDEIIEFSDVGRFIDTPVKYYSTGMRVRLAFSVAAHLDPEVLLIDEVLAVGDMSFQQKCLKRIQGITSVGRTVLLVSHSMGAITRYCTQCLWLENGVVVSHGSPEEVTSKYAQMVMGIQSERRWIEDEDREISEEKKVFFHDEMSESEENDIPTDKLANGPRNLDFLNFSDATLLTQPKEAAQVDLMRQSMQHDLSQTYSSSNEYVRIVSARVINEHRMSVMSIPINCSVGIEIVYDILKSDKNIQPALQFITAKDVLAFTVAYTDPSFICERLSTGRYVTTAWLPPNLLNAGVMYITIMMATPDPLERHVVLEKAISFYIHELDDGIGTARGLYSRDFPGVIRPLLRWDTKRL
jgi:lipopolysaccharide transport system ATP-binding protein